MTTGGIDKVDLEDVVMDQIPSTSRSVGAETQSSSASIPTSLPLDAIQRILASIFSVTSTIYCGWLSYLLGSEESTALHLAADQGRRARCLRLMMMLPRCPRS